MIGGSHRANCFDLIRHLAALTVLLSHHYALSKVAVPKFLGMVSYGNLSVTIFFAISGYLVTSSYARTGSFWLYFEKRLRRLFPGLIACSIFMVFGLCAFLGTDPFYKYAFSSRAMTDFLGLVWLEGFRDMNKFTSTFIYANAPNGSLWTLRYEFFSYIIIPACILLTRRAVPALILILAVSLAYQFLYFSGHAKAVNAYRLSALIIPYCVGALMYYLPKSLSDKHWRLGITTISILVIGFIPKHEAFSPVFNACIATLTIIIGSSFKDIIIAGKFDYSYGIYIYAFPIQQIMINMTPLGFWSSMAASAVVTISLAMASWHYIEKPFLRRSESGDVVVPSAHAPNTLHDTAQQSNSRES